MKNLNEILKMIEAKMDFFMIKACLSSIGHDLSSMSMPSLKNEVECLDCDVEVIEEEEKAFIEVETEIIENGVNSLQVYGNYTIMPRFYCSI